MRCSCPLPDFGPPNGPIIAKSKWVGGEEEMRWFSCTGTYLIFQENRATCDLLCLFPGSVCNGQMASWGDGNDEPSMVLQARVS